MHSRISLLTSLEFSEIPLKNSLGALLLNFQEHPLEFMLAIPNPVISPMILPGFSPGKVTVMPSPISYFFFRITPNFFQDFCFKLTAEIIINLPLTYPSISIEILT